MGATHLIRQAVQEFGIPDTLEALLDVIGHMHGSVPGTGSENYYKRVALQNWRRAIIRALQDGKGGA